MDQLTVEDLAAFREPVRDLCAARFDRSVVRESGQAQPLDRGTWEELAGLGLFAMHVDEGRGGLDLGLTATVSIWEELGAGLAPGPLVWAALCAGLVDGVADGTTIVAGSNDSLGVVPFAAEADALVVLTGVATLYPRGEFDARPLEPVDPLTSVAEVTGLGRGEVLADATEFAPAGTLLSAAYLVGASRLALKLAVQHALDRKQFGRPIGGFQAVKHLLADIAVAAELARAAVTQAAALADAGEDATRLIHAAKVTAGDAATLAGKNCVQVHGGMGYTWEADPHLIWKRCLVYEREFGDADQHAEALG